MFGWCKFCTQLQLMEENGWSRGENECRLFYECGKLGYHEIDSYGFT